MFYGHYIQENEGIGFAIVQAPISIAEKASCTLTVSATFPPLMTLRINSFKGAGGNQDCITGLTRGLCGGGPP